MSMFLILVLSLVIGVLFIMLKPEQCLYVLILSIPFDNTLKFATPIGFISIFDVALLTAGLSILVSTWSPRAGQVHLSNITLVYIILALLFLLSGIFSLIIAHVPSDALRALLTRVQYVGFFFICLGTLARLDYLRNALRVIAVGAVGTSIIVLGQGIGLFVLNPGSVSDIGRVIAGFQFPFARSPGLFDIYGRFGAYTAPGFAAAAISLIKPNVLKLRRWVSILACGLIGSAVLVTQSRSTWAAYSALVTVLVLLWLVYSYQSNPTRLLLLITSISGSLMVSLGAIAPLMINIKPETVFVRLQQLHVALVIFLQNPLLGVGKGAFIQFNMDTYGNNHVLHNIYANILVQSGLVGFIPIFILHLLPVLLLVRLLSRPTCDETRAAFVAALLAGYVAVLVELQFSSGLAYSSFWLAVGITAGAYFALTGRRPIRWLGNSA